MSDNPNQVSFKSYISRKSRKDKGLFRKKDAKVIVYFHKIKQSNLENF